MPLLLLILISLTTFTMQGVRHDQIHTIEVGQFNRIKITDDVNVVYRCVNDSTGLATFESDPEFANAFLFSVNNGELRIQVNTEEVTSTSLPTVHVYSDYLTSVENGGNCTLTVLAPRPCPEFKATQMGNGTIIVDDIEATEVKGRLATGLGKVILSGKCRKADLSILGTGAVQADRLEAQDVQCNLLGGGTIGCWAVDNLKVRGIGSTKIYYKGSPKVKKSGGGKLFPLDPEK